MMKKKTFNFLDFGHALGRSEMKKLMAGSGSDNCNGKACEITSGCFTARNSNCVPQGGTQAKCVSNFCT